MSVQTFQVSVAWVNAIIPLAATSASVLRDITPLLMDPGVWVSSRSCSFLTPLRTIGFIVSPASSLYVSDNSNTKIKTFQTRTWCFKLFLSATSVWVLLCLAHREEKIEMHPLFHPEEFRSVVPQQWATILCKRLCWYLLIFVYTD